MTPTRRGFLAGSAALPFLVRPARAQARAGYLRYGLSAFPPNLLPWESTGASAGTVKLLIGRSLVAYDKTGNLQGELATSWSLDDDGAWVFKLRRDAKFHNGEPVTADDVRWSVEQIAGDKSTAYMRAQFRSLARIETPDSTTIRFVTKQKLATLPSWFANYNMAICWKGSDPKSPIGCGPFRLAAQERGTSVTIEASPNDYKPGLPKLKGITFLAYPDESLRTAALQSGDLEMIEYVPWQSMATIEADPRLRLDEVPGAAFMDVLFNGTRPPFNDARVRQAVAHAVKREDIVQAAFFGRGKTLEGLPIDAGTPYYDDALAHGWNYDPARSKALLTAAGYPDGFQTTLLATAQYNMHKDTAVIVQQYLAAIGIQAELKLPDWSTRVSLGSRGQYDMAIHGVAADNNDPDGLTVVLDTSLSPSHGRSFGVQAPRTIEALARGRAEFDPAKRIAIYKDMQRAALEEVPLVGLAWRSQGYGMDRRVTGFTNLPGALSTSSGITLEYTDFT
ncbi:ABC transporter substrate-binding protein [Acidisphaera sp. L21]|uniref:ABC transporter substrate-binding protein n=1 Tax=Acidisphaera sp. L21 TaxID=1641851 RepID=UPI00131AC5BB|nr:ABC transporter substrate-binding protein [Acidisphaera sp. L21]